MAASVLLVQRAWVLVKLCNLLPVPYSSRHTWRAYVCCCGCCCCCMQCFVLRVVCLHRLLERLRTCESMSAEALVVASRSVVATDAFKKQSRTSELWLRILEVGERDLNTFLQEQRASGYTIIGAFRHNC